MVGKWVMVDNGLSNNHVGSMINDGVMMKHGVMVDDGEMDQSQMVDDDGVER